MAICASATAIGGGDMDDSSPYEPVAPNRHPDAFRLASISSAVSSILSKAPCTCVSRVSSRDALQVHGGVLVHAVSIGSLAVIAVRPSGVSHATSLTTSGWEAQTLKYSGKRLYVRSGFSQISRVLLHTETRRTRLAPACHRVQRTPLHSAIKVEPDFQKPLSCHSTPGNNGLRCSGAGATLLANGPKGVAINRKKVVPRLKRSVINILAPFGPLSRGLRCTPAHLSTFCLGSLRAHRPIKTQRAVPAAGGGGSDTAVLSMLLPVPRWLINVKDSSQRGMLTVAPKGFNCVDTERNCNPCLDAAKACNLNSSCKRQRSAYIATCSKEDPNKGEACSKKRCHKALRMFLDRVPPEFSHRLLFCPCQSVGCAERRRQTVVPDCSYQEKEKPNCLELRRVCRQDSLCR
ncbi:GDNF family receptor alpha-2 [Liparis tanakae]|uniref:GDNF family receptor alpha-2 n=1 Tax=Liparis tanakae TaxID=230148 RepID=A0A4Z2FLU3_9TELE|nr:GDNF family receptor alpha-2 [Liparis tanakae]